MGFGADGILTQQVAVPFAVKQDAGARADPTRPVIKAPIVATSLGGLSSPVPEAGVQTDEATARGSAAARALKQVLTDQSRRSASSGDATERSATAAAMRQLEEVTRRLAHASPPADEDKRFLKSFFAEMGSHAVRFGWRTGPRDSELLSLWKSLDSKTYGSDAEWMRKALGNGLLELSQNWADVPLAIRDLVEKPASRYTTDELSANKELSTLMHGPSWQPPANCGGPEPFCTYWGHPPDPKLKPTDLIGSAFTWVFGDLRPGQRVQVKVPYEDMESLTQMAAAADKDLVPGKELAENGMLRMAEMAEAGYLLSPEHSKADHVETWTGRARGADKPVPPNEYHANNTQLATILYDASGSPELKDHARTDLMLTQGLSVFSRNHEADAKVIANSDFLRGIVQYQWDDHGVTAGRAIDWIFKDSASGDPNKQLLARKALVEFGHTVCRSDTFGGFAASIARQGNHGLSESLAYAFEPNMDLLATADGMATEAGRRPEFNAIDGLPGHFSMPDAQHLAALAQLSERASLAMQNGMEVERLRLLTQAKAGQITQYLSGQQHSQLYHMVLVGNGNAQAFRQGLGGADRSDLARADFYQAAARRRMVWRAGGIAATIWQPYIAASQAVKVPMSPSMMIWLGNLGIEATTRLPPLDQGKVDGEFSQIPKQPDAIAAESWYHFTHGDTNMLSQELIQTVHSNRIGEEYMSGFRSAAPTQTAQLHALDWVDAKAFFGNGGWTGGSGGSSLGPHSGVIGDDPTGNEHGQ